MSQLKTPRHQSVVTPVSQDRHRSYARLARAGVTLLVAVTAVHAEAGTVTAATADLSKRIQDCGPSFSWIASWHSMASRWRKTTQR